MHEQKIYKYVPLSQILDVKIASYENTGRGMDMYDAAKHIYETGNYQCGQPEIPNFLSWNLYNYQDLRNLILQIPVYLDDVLSVKHQTFDDVLQSSTKYQVQISLEACYTDTHFMSVDYFIITYVLEGSCLLKMKHASQTMQAGELCIISPGLPYYVFTRPEDLVIYIISDRPHFEENFHALFYHDNLLSAFFRQSLFQDSKDCLFFMMPPTKDVNIIIQHLFAEFLNKDGFSETLFNSYLLILYAHIIRNMDNTYQYYVNRKEISAKNLMPVILKYIMENYHTISLEALASHFHYESVYLSKLIKQTTHKNFSSIITELKIGEAEELLQNTDRKIEEIAEITGYNSAAHFTYSFRKFTGLSPREYRKFHNSL